MLIVDLGEEVWPLGLEGIGTSNISDPLLIAHQVDDVGRLGLIKLDILCVVICQLLVHGATEEEAVSLLLLYY